MKEAKLPTDICFLDHRKCISTSRPIVPYEAKSSIERTQKIYDLSLWAIILKNVSIYHLFHPVVLQLGNYGDCEKTRKLFSYHRTFKHSYVSNLNLFSCISFFSHTYREQIKRIEQGAGQMAQHCICYRGPQFYSQHPIMWLTTTCISITEAPKDHMPSLASEGTSTHTQN